MCWSTRGRRRLVHDGGVAVSALRRTDSGVHDKAIRGDFVSSRAVGQQPALKDYMSPEHNSGEVWAQPCCWCWA